MWIRDACYPEMTSALNLAYARNCVCKCPRLRLLRPRLNAYQPHHSAVLVLQQMTVIDKRTDAIGVAEVHANLHTWVDRRLPVPERNVDRIAQKWLVDRQPEPLHQHEMDLVDVKCV